MKFKGLYTAVTALSLVAAPTMAAAAPVVTPLTQPAAETVDGDNALRLGGGGFVIGLISITFIVLGIIIITKENDSPNSP